MKVERFEDLIAWQKARGLNKTVYRLSTRQQFQNDFSLIDQMRRCSISIMSNIAEGFDRFRPTEFRQYLSIAKGSCAELRSQLYAAFDATYIEKQEFDRVYADIVETARIIGALRAAVEKRSRISRPSVAPST